MSVVHVGAPECQSNATDEVRIRSLVFGSVKKLAVFMIGGPASGKSTVKSLYLKSINRNEDEFAIIDPDFVLVNLPAFKHLEASVAADACYSTAAQINDYNLEYALENNFNIIFDGTGRNFEWTSGLMQRMREKQYTIHVCIVTLDVTTAIQRSDERARRTGRTVPTDVIKSIHTAVNANIKRYMQLPYSITVYDNGGAIPVVVSSHK